MLMLITLFACAGGDPEPAPTPEPAPEATPEPAKPAEAPAEKKVFFVSPADGAEVKNPVKVEFGVKGWVVKPAGTMEEGTGHHHIVIDGAFVPEGTVVPADDTHIHFGGGQTETEVVLSPGEHTLTMQLADGGHVSYGESASATIKVTVTE